MADPLPLCHLNGSYLPLKDARISPLDRGFLYADGAYEVMPVYGGRPFRFAAHADRLTRSLGALRMEDPHTRPEWREILGALIERNGGGDVYVYWQVTRGAQNGRTHAPLPDIPRTVFAFCAPLPSISPELLANVLLRQESIDAGAAETILLRDGELTEASASAVHVVLGREVLTPPNSQRILPGTTRSVVEEMASRAELPWRSAPVSAAQLRDADEIWISAATREVQAVTRLDGRPVGSGKPGPHWRAVYEELQSYKRELAGTPW